MVSTAVPMLSPVLQSDPVAFSVLCPVRQAPVRNNDDRNQNSLSDPGLQRNMVRRAAALVTGSNLAPLEALSEFG